MWTVTAKRLGMIRGKSTSSVCGIGYSAVRVVEKDPAVCCRAYSEACINIRRRGGSFVTSTKNTE